MTIASKFAQGPTLYVDDYNNRLGVNVEPRYPLHIIGDVVIEGSLTADSVGGTPAADSLVRYVSPEGSDGNDGLTAQSPYQNTQHAYDTLVSVVEANYDSQGADPNDRWGFGPIVLMPGDHNWGAGLSLSAHHSCRFTGYRGGFGHHWPGALGRSFLSRIHTTNSSATSLVSWGENNFITRGMAFDNLAFQIGYGGSFALTSAMEAKATDFLVVDECSFTTTDGNQSNEAIHGISQIIGTTANDCAWGRITNCIAGGVGLLKCSSDMGNHNGVEIAHNQIFYDHATESCIDLAGSGSGGHVHTNYSTGTSSFCRIDNRDSWVFSANEGESSGNVPFYKVNGPSQFCVFVGGKCTLPGTNGTWIEYSNASAHSNIVIGGDFNPTGSTGMKQKIVDSTPTFKNMVLSANGMLPRRYISAAGKTNFADGDFPSVVQDGMWGFVHNSTDNTYRLSARINGAWRAVEMT